MEVIIPGRIRRVIVNDDSRSVRYADRRCDSQSVGLPNVAIRSRVIINEGSGSDHPPQDQESDHQRSSADVVRSLRDTRTV